MNHLVVLSLITVGDETNHTNVICKFQNSTSQMHHCLLLGLNYVSIEHAGSCEWVLTIDTIML